MGSRYMVYWRVYVYSNNLYSLPERESRSFRDCTPLMYRRNSDEVHRLLSFANRELSVLLCNTQTELLTVFDVLLELILEINMKSMEFNATLAGYLGPKTNHFVHELINFARSPYDDLISYECNVQYSARPLDGSEGLGVLPIMLNFVDFSMCVDEDECVSFTTDLDVEDEDPDEIDELADLTDLNAPLLLELRRLLAERNNSSAATTLAPQPQRPTSQAQSQAASELSVQASSSSSSSSSTTAAAAAAAAASATSNLMSNGVLAQDIGLEVAIERSMLDRLGSDYFMPQRSQQMVSSASASASARYARNLATVGAVGNRSTDAGNAAAAAAAAAAVANATRAAQNTGVNPGLRAALRSAPRPRSSSVAPKRRRTTNRDLER